MGKTTSVVLGLGLCASSCSSNQPLIINGVVDNDHLQVVEITSSVGGCSGTYLGSGLILTAAHCLPANTSGDTVDVEFVDYDKGTSTTVSSTNYTTLPEALSASRDTTNDMGAIIVDNCQVPAEVTAMSVLDAQAGTLDDRDIGSTLTVVGFGATSAPTDTDPYGTGFGTRHRGTVTLDSLTSFDATVSESGSSDSPPCHGDSGGPLIITRGGTEYLAGTVSEGDCETDTTYVRADNNQNANFIGESAAAALLSLHSCSGSSTRTCSAGGSAGGVVPVVIAGMFIVMRTRRRRARG